MSFRKTLLLVAVVILVGITLLHSALNLHLFDARSKSAGSGRDKFRVGFLPVTCHLTCPVTDFINKQLVGESMFDPIRFHGWPELKEAYLSGYTPATFILAPMARTWELLRSIPKGETRSYSWMAEGLKIPKARRAVGRANGTNMLCLIIPCHRVIRADGTLCGYGGGLWRKKWLLEHERKFAA